jgi:hypothetical protein
MKLEQRIVNDVALVAVTDGLLDPARSADPTAVGCGRNGVIRPAARFRYTN